jgi:hypothetical protein
MSRNLIIIISIIVVIMIIVAIVLIKRKQKLEQPLVVDFTKPIIVNVKNPDGTTTLTEKTYAKNPDGTIVLKTKDEVKADIKTLNSDRG